GGGSAPPRERAEAGGLCGTPRRGRDRGGRPRASGGDAARRRGGGRVAVPGGESPLASPLLPGRDHGGRDRDRSPSAWRGRPGNARRRPAVGGAPRGLPLD